MDDLQGPLRSPSPRQASLSRGAGGRSRATAPARYVALLLLVAACSGHDQPQGASEPPPPPPAGAEFALVGDRESCAAVCPGDGDTACPDIDAIFTFRAGGDRTGAQLTPVGDLDADGRTDLALVVGAAPNSEVHFLSPRGDAAAGGTRLVELARWPAAFEIESIGAIRSSTAATTGGSAPPTFVVVARKAPRVQLAAIEDPTAPASVTLVAASLPSEIPASARFGRPVPYGEGLALLPFVSDDERGVLVLATWRSGHTQASVFRWYSEPNGGQSEPDRIAAVGDVDGDGLPDFVRSPAEGGRVELFAGAHYYRQDSVQTAVAPPAGFATPLAFRLQGDTTFAGLAGLGDVNGDGRGDFVVAFPGSHRLDLVSGAQFAADVTAAGPSGAQVEATFVAAPTFQDFSGPVGRVVASAGDVDGDGLPDVAVTIGNDVVVLSGHGLARIKTFEGGNGARGFGEDVATLGDVDGNGLADVAIGVSYFDPAEARWTCDRDTLVSGDPYFSERIDCAAVGAECRQTDTGAYCAPAGLVSARCDGNLLSETWRQQDNTEKTETLDCARTGRSCAQVEGELPRCLPPEEAQAFIAGHGRSVAGPSVFVMTDPEVCRRGRVCWGHGVCDGATQCRCAPGWTGVCCETPTGGGDCTSDGACVHGTCEAGRCACEPGWGGLTCDSHAGCAEGRFGSQCEGTCPGATDDGPERAVCTNAKPLRTVALTSSHAAFLGGIELGVLARAMPGDVIPNAIDGVPDLAVGQPIRHFIAGQEEPWPVGDPCTPATDPDDPDPCGWRQVCALQPDGSHACIPDEGLEGAVVFHDGRWRFDVPPDSWQGGVSELTPDDRFGATLASPGDIDGDGFPDLVVGAPGADVAALDRLAGGGCYDPTQGRTVPCSGQGQDVTLEADSVHAAAGRVYVYASRSENSPSLYTFEGAAPQARLGGALGGDPRFPELSDFDGDGLADILAAAPGNQNMAGHIYVWSGRTGALLLDASQPDADTAETNLGFGETLSPVPDLDGDGRPDIAVGAPNALHGAGAVLVISSASGQVLDRRVGERAGQHFGSALALRRLADGRAALVIGAPGTSEHVFFAQPRCPGVSPTLVSCDAAHVVRGAQALSGFGTALAALPDLNGDGVDEIAIGEPYAMLRLASRGRVSVRDGAEPTRVVFELEGRQAGGQFGARLGWAGDVNGDGAHDLLVATPYATVDRDGDGRDDLYGDDDLDGDGVLDDGDGSGAPGDHPCRGGQTTGCDDNCPFLPNADQAAPSDGVGGVGAACQDGNLVAFSRGAYEERVDIRMGRLDVFTYPVPCLEAAPCGPRAVCDQGRAGDGACQCPGGAEVSYADAAALDSLDELCLDTERVCANGVIMTTAAAAAIPDAQRCTSWAADLEGDGCTCLCGRGTWGPNCANGCGRIEYGDGEVVDCGGGGECRSAVGCVCEPWAWGPNCGYRIDVCTQTDDPSGRFDPSLPARGVSPATTQLYPLREAVCANGGTCWTDPQPPYWSCDCPDGWFGPRCQETCPAAQAHYADWSVSGAAPPSLPCSGVGRCDEYGDCVCDLGFAGDACEIPLDACEWGACDPAASCHAAPGAWTCECKPGVTPGYGSTCSADLPWDPCERHWFGEALRPLADVPIRDEWAPQWIRYEGDAPSLTPPASSAIDAEALAGASVRLESLAFFAHRTWATADQPVGWTVETYAYGSVAACLTGAGLCAPTATGVLRYRESSEPAVGRKLAWIDPPLELPHRGRVRLVPDIASHAGAPLPFSDTDDPRVGGLPADAVHDDQGMRYPRRLLVQLGVDRDYHCGIWRDLDDDLDLDFRPEGQCTAEEDGVARCDCGDDPLYVGPRCDQRCPSSLWGTPGQAGLVQQMCSHGARGDDDVLDPGLCDPDNVECLCRSGLGQRCTSGTFCDYGRAVLVDGPGRGVGGLECGPGLLREHFSPAPTWHSGYHTDAQAPPCTTPYQPGRWKAYLGENVLADDAPHVPTTLSKSYSAYALPSGAECGRFGPTVDAASHTATPESVLEFTYTQEMRDSAASCSDGVPGSWSVAVHYDIPEQPAGPWWNTRAAAVSTAGLLVLKSDWLAGSSVPAVEDPEAGFASDLASGGPGRTCHSASRCMAAEPDTTLTVLDDRGIAAAQAQGLDTKGAEAMRVGETYYLILEQEHRWERTQSRPCTPEYLGGSPNCRNWPGVGWREDYVETFPVPYANPIVTMEPCACLPTHDACWFDGDAAEVKTCGDDGCGDSCGVGCAGLDATLERSDPRYGVCDTEGGRCYVPGESCFYPAQCRLGDDGPIRVYPWMTALACWEADTAPARDRYRIGAGACRGEDDAHGAGAPELVYAVVASETGYYRFRLSQADFDAVLYLAEPDACGPDNEPFDRVETARTVTFDSFACIGAADRHDGAEGVQDEVLVDRLQAGRTYWLFVDGARSGQSGRFRLFVDHVPNEEVQ